MLQPQAATTSVHAPQVLHLPGLVDLEVAVLLAPAVMALLGGLRLLARQRQILVLGRLHLNLAQLQHTCSALAF